MPLAKSIRLELLLLVVVFSKGRKEGKGLAQGRKVGRSEGHKCGSASASRKRRKEWENGKQHLTVHMATKKKSWNVLCVNSLGGFLFQSVTLSDSSLKAPKSAWNCCIRPHIHAKTAGTTQISSGSFRIASKAKTGFYNLHCRSFRIATSPSPLSNRPILHLIVASCLALDHLEPQPNSSPSDPKLSPKVQPTPQLPPPFPVRGVSPPSKLPPP